MPFIDLNGKTRSDLNLTAVDITIVGAGAAGILLAVNLSKKGKRVLLLESGHYGEDPEKQSLNEVHQTGKRLDNAVWGRKRAVGGTTIAWGGQSLPFSELDFSRREWVKNSGWPIPYDELAPYYKEANAFMGIDTLDYRSDILPNLYLEDPGIDPSRLDYHVSKWAKQPDFHLLYKDFLAVNVTVLYNAHLVRIEKEPGGSIGAIRFTNFKGETFSCNPGILIIAAGGIETVRILLTNGFDGRSGLLGKFFMEHPCIEIGEVTTKDPYRLQKYFNTHAWQGRKYSVRISLSGELQRQKELLNCSASIMFVPPGNAFDPYGELKSFRNDFRLRRLIRVSASMGRIARSLWAFYRDRFYYKVGGTGKLVLMTEQEPIPGSHISLSAEKDVFGIPKALICWQITQKTWKTVVETSRTLKEEVERLAFGEVSLYPTITPENSEWSDCLSDVNHHMGGCRMSTSSSEGVVDTNLRVWDVPNLYVSSCAVFPTSSHSNPTLTLLALSVRLSEWLTKNAGGR